MKYDLAINEHNVKPHLDIEKDIQNKKNGLFTFNLRINQGQIEDYAKYETVVASDYTGFIVATFTELTVTRHIGGGSQEDGLRTDVSKRSG